MEREVRVKMAFSEIVQGTKLKEESCITLDFSG